MKNRAILSALAAAVALAVTGCQSAQLDVTPNPVIVGLFDTSATIHAHVVTKGFGQLPFDHVQFAAYDNAAKLLASSTEKIDASGNTTTMDRDYTIPINGAAVALSHTNYIEVRFMDPNGKVLAARQVGVVVHVLKGLSLPSILQPRPLATPTPNASP
jgi:hypothetical protein